MCTWLIYQLLTLGAYVQQGLQSLSCFSVCLSVLVSDTSLQASVVDQTLKFHREQSVNDTLECFDSWILLTMLRSRVMTEYVS